MIQYQKFRSTEQLLQVVNGLFAEWDKQDTPGCAVGIVKAGKLEYRRGFGMANIEHGIPVSINTVFDIGSDSKKFVALSIVLLARQGLLTLDDDIRSFIPEMMEYEYVITIRDLLRHTSGIRDYFYLAYFSGFDYGNSCPVEDVISLIARQSGLNFRPGTEFQYSNSGYFLLAEIVKRVSGLSQRAFADLHIFGPLGMKNTHFHDNHKDILRNRADGYTPKDGGGFEICMSNFDVVGAGGVYSTIEDLCLWDANFYNNIIGGYGKDLIDEITSPSHLGNGDVLVGAFGFNITNYRGLKVVMHGGTTPGYQSQMMRFPEQDFTVICLSNDYRSNPTRLCHSIADEYLSDVFTEQVAPVAAKTDRPFLNVRTSELESKVGFFHGKDDGEIWDIELVDGKLMVMAHEMGAKFEVRPTSKNAFESIDFYYDLTATFDDSAANVCNALSVCHVGKTATRLQRVERVNVSIDELSKYCGSFHSEELDATYSLAMEGDKIAFSFKGFPKVFLEGINRTVFNCPGVGIFEFSFNESGVVTGFSLSAGRVRGINFSRC